MPQDARAAVAALDKLRTRQKGCYRDSHTHAMMHRDVVRARTEAVIAHAMAANKAFQQAEAREKYNAMWQSSTGAPSGDEGVYDGAFERKKVQRKKPIRPVDDGLGDDDASEEGCAREKVCHSYPPEMSKKLRQLNARRRELARQTERQAQQVLEHSGTVSTLAAELTNAKTALDQAKAKLGAAQSTYEETKRELKAVMDEYSALLMSGIREARLLDSSDDSACKSSSDEDEDPSFNGLQEGFEKSSKLVPYRNLAVLPAPP